MAGFLYYIEGYTKSRTPTREELNGWGLSHLAGLNLAIRETTAGPEGKGAGIILAVDQAEIVVGGEMPRTGFYPDKQTWAPAGAGACQSGDQKEDSSLVRVGWETERLPGPKDLELTERRFGHDVKMADGNVWHVPAARYLPQKIQMINGEVRYVPKAEFARFEAAVSQCWLDYMRDCGIETAGMEAEKSQWEKEHLSEARQVEMAVGFLGLNYRIGREEEINALEILDQLSLIRMLEAIMDIPGWIQLAKGLSDEKKKGNGSRHRQVIAWRWWTEGKIEGYEPTRADWEMRLQRG